MTEEIRKLNQQLLTFKTQVLFTKNSLRDYKSFPKGTKIAILALLLKQAQKGARFKPEGNGNQLDPPLHKFAKIKPKAMSLRIVYRPVDKGEIVEMQIIAIGPRDRNEVYELAKKRMGEFFKEVK